MAVVWGLFEDYGTGGFAADAWVRKASIDSAGNFAWLSDRIAFPAPIWNYLPDDAWGGYLAVDPRDTNILWVGSCVLIDGTTLYTRIYTYTINTDTWDLLMDMVFGGASTPFIVDMAFDPDGSTFVAIGGNGARGRPGGVIEGGVYKSDNYGTFTSAGSGHGHAFNSGNSNFPASLTALDLSPDTGEGRVLYTAHTLTRLNGSQNTGWVTSFSGDDGSNWFDPLSTYNGNQFRIECLTCMRLWGGGSGLWYCADNSGTGAYSTSFLTARITGSPSDGPTGGYGGGIESSGAIAYPIQTSDSKIVAFPTQDTLSSFYHSGDGGETWTETTRASGHRGPFNYRGGRTARDSEYAGGFSLANANHDSEVWWTPDAGATWYTALAEEDAHGLSMDFGTSAPAVPMVLRETLTWRDARNLARLTGWYISGDTDAERRTNAQAIIDLITPLSTATLTAASGPYTTPPQAPTPGSMDTYQMAESVALLRFLSETGTVINVEVPCPSEALFESDQENYSNLNADLAAARSGIPNFNLCTRGGSKAVVCLGVFRTMTPIRTRLDIRSLDPTVTDTGL